MASLADLVRPLDPHAGRSVTTSAFAGHAGPENVRELLQEELRNLYTAEHQMHRAIPRVLRAVQCEALSMELADQRLRTAEYLARLEQIFTRMRIDSRGIRVRGVEGMIADLEDRLLRGGDLATLDLAILSDVRRIGHYQIGGYASVRQWAASSGDIPVATLLEASLCDKVADHRRLSGLADGGMLHLAGAAVVC